jgi:hypothetical protein
MIGPSFPTNQGINLPAPSPSTNIASAAIPTSVAISHQPVTHARAPLAIPSVSGPRPPMPAKYSGSTDNRDVKEFITELEFWFQLSSVPASQWSSWGSMLLLDEAKLYLNSKLHELGSGTTLFSMPWPQFCHVMITGYFKPVSYISARADLNSLTQGSMTVPQLSREFQRLTVLVQPAISEPEKIYLMLSALRPQLRRVCTTAPDGSEWSSLHLLQHFATLKESNSILSSEISGKKQIDTSSPYSVVSKTKRSGEDLYPQKRSQKHLPGAIASKSSRLKLKHQRSGAAGTTPFGTSTKVLAEQRASKRCFYCNGDHLFSRRTCPLAEDAVALKRSPFGNTPKKGLTCPE